MTSSNDQITEQITGLILKPVSRWRWFAGFTVAFALMMMMLYSIAELLVRGIGIWGVRVPVGWGFAIVNFVWWIGIGHAGTFISAFLLVLRQDWRSSINRCAEAMTLFALACAGLFPLLHLGRPFQAYWLFPYPNTMELGPQFRSPLMWDVFAISTYLIVSALFWYIGLLPDVASMRDRAKNLWAKRAYGMLAMGWRGSSAQWSNFRTAALLLAGLATPLVISVHSIVSLDFTAGVVPGWHSTIFPPFFVAGALYSGFAMVLTILIPIRHFYRLEKFITDEHLDKIALVLLATGTLVAYGYFSELIVGWYSGDIYEEHMMLNRFTGVYAPYYWAMLLLNVIVPQLFWSRKIRANAKWLFGLAILINIGMWLERFIIVVSSLSQDFLPSSWGIYKPTGWDWSLFTGTIGLFFSLLFIFVRLLPIIAIAEVKESFAEEVR